MFQMEKLSLFKGEYNLYFFFRSFQSFVIFTTHELLVILRIIYSFKGSNSLMSFFFHVNVPCNNAVPIE